MTFFKQIKALFYRVAELRIWFASISVIVLFLLLALTVNSAREKDIVEIFSQQQLASVQNIATRMHDVFYQTTKNIELFSKSYHLFKKSPHDMERYYAMLSSGWENTLDSMVQFDVSGRIQKVYPPRETPSVNLSEQFKRIKETQKEYVDVVFWDSPERRSGKNEKGDYLIIGVPIRDKNTLFDGAWIVVFSLPAVVNKYRPSGYEWGDLWILDENLNAVTFRESAFVEMNIAKLFSEQIEKKVNFFSEQGGYFEATLGMKGRKQRSIVTYYPLTIGNKKWVFLSISPYSKMMSPLRKTFFYTLFSSLLLIIVVIIASMSLAYREGKRLRMREEQKRLKERSEWQEKLLREKKTIEGIIEGLPIPCFVINREHKIILWNRACTELTGYTAEAMIGTNRQYMPFYSVPRPVIADLVVDNEIENLSKYYGTKEIKKSENVLGAYEATDYFENMGGRGRYLYFLAAPIYDEMGEVIAAIETLQDITRDKEMTKNLNEYAETLQNELMENIELRRKIEVLYNYLYSIVNSLPDKIYEIDENGIIHFVSHGWRKNREAMSDDYKNKYFLDLVAPEYRDFVLSKWQEAKRGIYNSYEIEVTSKTGRRYNLLITTAPVMGTRHYLVVQRDITEYKDLERKLYDSQKLAALGQLSAGIAHEIRNPLSSIKMSLQILAKRMNPQGNDLKRFKIAEKEVEHLETLVNDILAFAKPVEPRKSPVKLSKVVEHALTVAEKIIMDKKIDVRTEFADIPPVSVDAAMMADAFLNVIRNAVEASKECGKINIGLRYAYESRQAVVAEFRDEGIGIPEEDMPHIFNPFFTRKNYGTGLGLSLVKKIVDMHQGTIDVVSKPREGTKVVIILPLGNGTPSTGATH